MQTAPGSPPLSKLEVAGDTPPASVKVKVSHGHGSRWSLSLQDPQPRARHQRPLRGTGPRQHPRARHRQGRRAGTLRFAPQDALSRARRIVAYLLNAEGAPVRVLSGRALLRAGCLRGGRVRAVRIARHGLTALVTWGAATGTRVYRIQVRGSDGRLQTFFRKPGSRSVLLANVLPFETFTATVTARGGPNLLPGPGATVRLGAVKVKVVRKAGSGKRRARKKKG